MHRGVAPVCVGIFVHELRGEQNVSFLLLQLKETFENLAQGPRHSGTRKGLDNRTPEREQ